jgi:tetratricopeptide (TPR) repeat protein
MSLTVKIQRWVVNSMFMLKSSVFVQRLLLLAMVTLTLAGCAGTPSKSDRPKDAKGIYFVENRSVDMEVRKNFTAAVKLLEAKQYPQAIDLLKKVIKGSQNNSAPYINIAIAYERIDEPKKAEEYLKKALEINPDHPAANNEYALLYRRSGRYSEARELYERVVEKYPEYMPVRKNYGILCELYLDNAECALEQYEIYSKANPEDEDVKLWITTLKRKLGG